MSEPPDLLPAEEPVRTRARIVQDFAYASRTARSIVQLRSLLCEATWALGFHHLLLQGAQGEVWLADLPPGWNAVAAGSGDAVLAAAVQSYAPFFVVRHLPFGEAYFNRQQRDFLDAAHAAGIGAAVSAPIHRPRGAQEAGSYSVFAGCCSFLMKNKFAAAFGKPGCRALCRSACI